VPDFSKARQRIARQRREKIKPVTEANREYRSEAVYINYLFSRLVPILPPDSSQPIERIRLIIWKPGVYLKKKKALYLSVKVFSKKVLIGDTILTSPTGNGTAILRDHPSHAKV